jgi:hypothetical protein
MATTLKVRDLSDQYCHYGQRNRFKLQPLSNFFWIGSAGNSTHRLKIKKRKGASQVRNCRLGSAALARTQGCIDRHEIYVRSVLVTTSPCCLIDGSADYSAARCL